MTPRVASPPAVAAVSIRRVAPVAPAAVSVRISLAASLRIKPTVIASTPRASSMPIAIAAERSVSSPPCLSRASMVNPDLGSHLACVGELSCRQLVA